MTDSEIVGEAAKFPAGKPCAPHGLGAAEPSPPGAVASPHASPAASSAGTPHDPEASERDVSDLSVEPRVARSASDDRSGRPHVSAAELVAVLTALAIGVGYLLAPLMGGDLSAQLARADFAAEYPLTPVDLRWFGGFLPFGYSTWVPWLMGGIGVRVTGVLATILATWLTARLFVRTGARRAVWGAAAAAVTLGSNLVEGRVTFACGIVCGLAALLGISCAGRPRRLFAGTFAFLAGAASPVAALLLAVCAAALLARRRFADAAVLMVSVVPAAVLSLLFADPGPALFSANDAFRAIAISAVLVAVVPVIEIRIAATVGAVLVLVLFLVSTPVGVSSARLTLLFAVPVLLAYAAVNGRWVAVVVALAVLAQPPITLGTLSNAGSDATQASYYQPLLDQIAVAGPLTGRVEVPELTGHWEAYYVARRIPIARGWLRQTDIGRNDDVFYDQRPNAQSYQAFLQRTATQYVAVADAPATYYGRREIDLIDAGLPYLRELWRSAHWRLYAVDGATPIVSSPGVLVAQDASHITLDAPPGSVLQLRLRWWRWLTLDGEPGACIERSSQGVALRVGSLAGSTSRYVISSSLTSGSGRGHC
jgi:hypothetical protein